MAENQILIQFKAEDKGVLQAINSIAKAQGNLNKVQNTANKSVKKLVKTKKQEKEITDLNIREYNLLNKSLKDIEKSTSKLGLKTKTVTKAAGGQTAALSKVRRATGLAKREYVDLAGIQEKAAIAAEKHRIAIKKQAEATALNTVQLRITKSKLDVVVQKLKDANLTYKKAGITTKVWNLALKGNAKALSLVNQATTIAIKKTGRLNKGFLGLTGNGRLLHGSFATIRSKLLLLSFAMTIVSKLVLDQVKAFGIQEDSVRRLVSVFGTEGANALNAYSSELQEVSIFGDESINVAMAQFGAFGLNIEQTKKLAKATLDLASGFGLDLNNAALLVAKSIGSTTNALGRYDISLKGAKTQQEKVSKVIDEINQKYEGLAETLSKTTSGSLSQAANAFGDLQEEIGSALVPVVRRLAKSMKSLSEMMSENIMMFKMAFTALATFTTVLIGGRVVIKLYALALKNVKLVTTAYTAASKGATISTVAFSAALKANPLGIVLTALTVIVPVLAKYMGWLDGATEAEEKRALQLQESKDAEREYAESVEKVNESIQKKIDLLEASTEIEKFAIQNGIQLADVNRNLFDTHQRLNAELEEEKRLQDAITKAINSTKRAKLDAQKELLKGMKKSRLLKENELKDLKTLQKQQKGDLEIKEKALKASQALERQERNSATQIIEGRTSLAAVTVGYVKAAQKANENTKKLKEEFDELKKTPQDVAILTEEIYRLNQAIVVTTKKVEDMEADMGGLTAKQEQRREYINEAMSLVSELAQREIDSAREVAQAEIDILKEQEQRKLELLRASTLYKLANDKNKQKMEEKIIKDTDAREEAARKKANKRMKKMFYVQKALNLAEAGMNIALAITDALPKPWMIPWIAGLGAAQIAMIASQEPPKMKYGGLIGGEPHSRGGTMIEAERGEFVMSKRAVDAVGLETMNKINAGSSTGDVNISFSGNVMSKDFIEDEAVPQIKEALRRGGDIGVN